MRRAGYLAVLSAFGMCLNFLVQWYILVFFGPGENTDALFGAMVVPQFFVLLTSGPLVNVLIPLLSISDSEERPRDSWTLFWIVTGISALACLLFIVTAPLWVAAILPGLDAATRDKATSLAQIQTLGVVFSSQYAVVWAKGHAEKRFVRTELGLLASHATSFAVLYGAVQMAGIQGAAWTNVARPVLQVIFLIGVMGMPSAPQLDSNAVQEAWRRLKPLLIGSLYFKTEILVDRLLSSLAPAGGLSLLFFARQLYNSGNGILSKALVAPAVPDLAQRAKNGDWVGFRHVVRTRVFVVSALVGVGYLALVLLGKDILALVIGYGGVTQANLDLLHLLLLGLGGMIGALGQLLASAFYAFGDTRTPTRASMFGYTVGIGLKVGGFVWLGLFGLSLGITAYYFLQLGLLLWLLKKRVHEREFAPAV